MASVTLRYALPDLWDALLKYVQLSPISANNGGDASLAPTTPASKKELKKKEKEDRKKEKEKEKEEKKKEKEEKKKAKERGN